MILSSSTARIRNVTDRFLLVYMERCYTSFSSLVLKPFYKSKITSIHNCLFSTLFTENSARIIFQLYFVATSKSLVARYRNSHRLSTKCYINIHIYLQMSVILVHKEKNQFLFKLFSCKHKRF